MYLYKKILIVIIWSIFSYILFCLLLKRREIFLSKFEGLTNRYGSLEITNMSSKTGTGISSVSIDNSNLPLREYCIKSSYNSALSGKYISIESIKYVLSRGCRFLDFEVYYIDNAPCVAYSTDPTFVTITSQNYITLNQALQMITVNAFSAPSPNLSDPIFIQLRIKSNNIQIYNLIGMSVNNYLSSKLYKGSVDGNTLLSELMGKVVLVIDKNIAPDYNNIINYPKCNVIPEMNSGCYNLSSYKNIDSGTSALRMYTYTNLLNQATRPPTIIDSDNKDTDVSLFRLVQPDFTDKDNPSCSDLIVNYGVQFITNRFYITDSNLTIYETLFFDHNTAFVPISNAITYFNV